MSQILTFLGEGGPSRTTLAVAVAKAAAQQGRRVLLLGHQPGPRLSHLLGDIPLSIKPVSIAPNLSAIQLHSTQLLEQVWTQMRELEAEYVRTPFSKEIYGQELAILPGMDSALALDCLRRFDEAGEYDCLIYDGPGDLTLLRMFGIPEVASWYWRRASNAFLESDLAKTLRPFAEPLIRSVTNIEFSSLDDLPRQAGGMTNWLEKGREAIADPNRVLAHLVTTTDPLAIRTARYLWGSAQMVGLTVGSLLISPMAYASHSESIDPAEFAPLPLISIPQWSGKSDPWETLIEAVRPVLAPPSVPPPLAVDEAAGVVKLFIPGFSKSEIELSQSGPELTITAGDQRRNLSLPPNLAGRQVKSAKFQEQFLIISLA